MKFSDRKCLTKLVDEWFKMADREIAPYKVDRSTEGVVDALDSMGYLKDFDDRIISK